MLLGSADVQAADKASQRVRFRASCKKFKNLPDYMVKTTCEAIQPLFNSTFDAQTGGESKLMYLCCALGVELDTWLPSHYIEECWYQDAFIDMCRARYTELGCRLAVLPATAKLWSFDADTGKAMLAMCGKQIEFAIPSCPVPVPEDASIDNPFGLSCKFLCPSAFVTVPLVEVVKALPDEQVGELRVQLLDPSSPWEKKASAKRCHSEAPGADMQMEDQETPPSKSSRLTAASEATGSKDQAPAATRIERKSSFSQSIFSQLKGSGKAPALRVPPP
eukprot:6476820-Amphidinium_carterae.2